LYICRLSNRATKQGLVGVATQGNVAAIVEINCETDFVAKADEFKSLVGRILIFHATGCGKNTVFSKFKFLFKISIFSPNNEENNESLRHYQHIVHVKEAKMLQNMPFVIILAKWFLRKKIFL
jgi:translation elongation factor EF-Ts